MTEIRLALEDMLDAIARIEAYAPDSVDALRDDRMRCDAIERNFITLGEAANRVPRTFQANHPGVPWGKVIGMRHILTHHYEQIKLDVVWAAVTNELGPLREHLERILGSTELPAADTAGNDRDPPCRG